MEIYKDLTNPASQEFEKLLDSQLSKIQIEEGKIIEGKINKITEKFVFLFVEGLKSEPVLDINELKSMGLSEKIKIGETIAVADSLGATHDDDGLRITGFGAAGDNPSFSSSTNYYTGSAWSSAETVAGTQEAITRWGTLQHFTTDLSSGYLPTGPDLNTGRSGAQYYTFVFRRSAMANFNVTLTGTVSGFFIAAPATDIDDASSINGWLDAGITYNGAGTPGADTSNGGNGSNGCAFTSGDRIVDGTSYSSSSFELTLGDQNGTNSFGNQILVRIKLESGDSLTAISIA